MPRIAMGFKTPGVVLMVLSVVLAARPLTAQNSPRCGGQLNQQSGLITSPNYPDSYPNYQQCYWTITAKEHEIIDIMFSKLDLEGTVSEVSWIQETCPDFVKVYDGDSENAPLIKTLCRTQTQSELAQISIRSTKNKMHVVFVSDYDGQRSGFVATYWTHVCLAFTYGVEACNRSCECVPVNTASCNNTNGNCNCKTGWESGDCSRDVDECLNPRVEPCPGDYRECVNTEGSFDCVCRDGLIESYQGDCTVDSSSTCGEENICSHLCVNISNQNQAEVAHCYCPVNMELVENSCQACSNVAFGNDCRFGCSCIPANTQSCDVITGGCICLPGWTSPDCSRDIDECTELRGKVCPSPAEQCVNTQGSYECRCRSGASKSPSGSCEGCSHTLTDRSGIIQSPNYPEDAYDNVHCNWTITSQQRGATILLSLSQVTFGYGDWYGAYCYYGVLEVYDGNSSDATLLGRFCGYYRDTINVQSSGNVMYLVFRTDTNRWARHFNGSYSVREYQAFRSVLSAPSDILASPGYPASYPFNVVSSWTISVSLGSVVTFSFADYQLGECGQDYIEVYDGSHFGVKRIAYFCGNNFPRKISSTDSSMLIVYSSVSTTSERGFNGSYITDACKCRWDNTESCNPATGPCVCKSGFMNADCAYDINECEHNPCPPHSQCLNSYGSFTCYCWNGTLVKASGLCDDWEKILRTQSGDIQSQYYPESYPRNVNYSWTISGKPNTVVSLRVSDFDLEGVSKCYKDAVEVYDVIRSSFRLIGQYCGKSMPNLLRTTGPDMLIIFKTDDYNLNRNYKGFKASYYSHVCPLFMYGEESCSRLCSCVYDTTQVCDNTNGVCFCKSGWVGRGCSQDLDECLNPDVCPTNSECINQPGNYTCECLSGYVMDDVTHNCKESSSCGEEMKQNCSHLCDVNPDNNQETCFCPEGLVLLSDEVTCVVPLYPYGPEAADFEVHEPDNYDHAFPQPGGLVEFSTLLAVGNSLVSTINVLRSGVIAFQPGEIRRIPDLKAAHEDKFDLLAPFWTEQNSSTAGQVYCHVYETHGPSVFAEPDFNGGPSPMKQDVLARAVRDIKLFSGVSAFEVSLVITATWKDVQPMGCEDTFRNTYQAVLISGYTASTAETYLEAEERAYAVVIYKDGDGICKPGQPFQVGISSDCGVTSLQTDRNSPQLAKVTGNTGYKGVVTFEVGKMLGASLKCQRYLWKHANLLSNQYFQSEVEELYKCPCSLDKLGLQWEHVKDVGDTTCFAISSVAKRRLLRNNQRNRLCCYFWTPPKSDRWEDWQESWQAGSFIPSGHILISDPWPSSSFGNARSYRDAEENMEAQSWCCGSSPYKFCNRFYKLFGDLQCSIHPIFVPASALGDPDIETLDGLRYLMNGWGEFIMLDIPSNNFTLQARTQRVEINSKLSNGTVFTAFAAQEGADAKFQVQLSSTNTTLAEIKKGYLHESQLNGTKQQLMDTSMDILADGMDFTKAFYRDKTFTRTTSSMSVMRRDENTRVIVVVTFSCGVSIKVHVDVKSLGIDLEIVSSLQNKTRGLLGTFNGDPTDDFLLPNGTTLSANSTERKIFELFAKCYLVTKNNSVFTYEKGESTESYQHPEFEPVFLDEAEPAKMSEAKSVCGNNLACINDYIATGSVEFAKSTKEKTEMNDLRDQRLKNSPPKIRLATATDNNFWIVYEGKQNIATVVAEDDDKDDVACELAENTDGVSLDHEGTLTYTPARDNPINLRVRAKDAKGSYSSILELPIKVCPLCNGHGTCNVNGTHAQFLAGQFQILKCTCFPAYHGMFCTPNEGDTCESEFDACKTTPCSVGQNCIDLTVAEQGNSSVGYRCGPCPAGTKNINGLCEEVNECADSASCDQECLDTYGSYQCRCRQGFRLDLTNKRTCHDINECVEGRSDCEQICENTIGSYKCGCKKGYTMSSDSMTCVIDSNVTCEQCDQICTISNDQVICDCKLGYTIDENNPKKCSDIDECSNGGKSPCSQICVNTIGKYECSCRDGFKLDGDGVSCLECESNHFGYGCSSTCDCQGRGTCDNVRGCICDKQWSGANCDKDVNECADSSACAAGLICHNEIGSFSCVCPDGYRKENGICSDIDECSDYNNRCDPSVEDCYNNIGSYSCKCKEGYTRNANTGSCEDINECESYSNGCEHICENGPGSYKCACNHGYTLAADRLKCEKYKDVCNLKCDYGCSDDNNGTPTCFCPLGYRKTGTDACKDINECLSDDDNLCDHKDRCNNTQAGFHCSCTAGYSLENDGRTCTACSRGTWGVQCANSCACGIGAITCDAVAGCVCKPGYTGEHCDNVIDRCASGEVTCLSTEECVISGGNSVCQCRKGFAWSNGQCQDENECQNSRQHNCQHVCTNTEGSYRCSCHSGYSYNSTTNTCSDINECQNAEIHNCVQVCNNIEGSYACSCHPGYNYNTSTNNCHDENECLNSQQHNCQHVCTNTEGSYRCSCHSGYSYNSTTNTCSDINECQNAEFHNCVQVCNNIEGSYACSCHPGYHYNTSTNNCYDENECLNSQQHNCQHVCTNTEGSYRCSCHSGYSYNSTTNTCSDINECQNAEIHNCVQVCNNIEGSYACSCHPGYNYNTSTNNCYDENECLNSQQHNCQHVCTNTEGSYRCSCHSGYSYNSTTNTCSDINECQNAEIHNCVQVCNNIEGSYACSCHPGYNYNTSTNNCYDENECLNSQQHNCQHVCTNTEGSYRCSCHSGYSYNSTTNTCSDINECQNAEIHNCVQVCNNIEGSYACSCHTGYNYNTSTNNCYDEDECSDKIKNNCDQICANTVGSFTCSCKNGYNYNSTDQRCYDIDECQTGKPCSNFTKCRNLNGSFECLCWNGLHTGSDGTCKDCNRTLTEETGYIMSSNHPATYPSNAYCSWTIKVRDPDAIIVFSFLSFDLDACLFDFIRVYNSDSRSAPSKLVCSNWQKPVTSIGNSLRVTFTSGFHPSKSGFLAAYTSYVPCKTKICSHTCSVVSSSPRTEKCQCPDWMKLDPTNDSHCVSVHECNTVITEPTGSLVSTNYPENYPVNSNCHWTLRGDQNSIITLSFADFALETSFQCSFDYVRIHDGSSESAQLLGNFCGKTVPANITSSGNTVYITFKSDAFFSYRGFRITYIIQEK